MSSVDIYVVKAGNRKRRLGRHDNVDVEPDDSDGLRDLTKRLAKEHRVDPESVELHVQRGRKKEKFRL